ncbi:nitronate monooxygenase, partial [Mycolicibacterium holsaticum]|uniref:nitronate monooxygenase n=1 Tax=Mycolicibacterium holsaticum TaxID=152142 RepID=UPI000AFC450A
MLATDWSARMGLRVPIVNAPMGGVAGAALAAAVSRAGGLGMLGMGSSASRAKLETELIGLSGLEFPFGIGLVDWVAAAEPGLLDAALAARPALLSVGFGDDFSWVAPARDAGVTTATQVGDLAAAQRAVDSRVLLSPVRLPAASFALPPRSSTLFLALSVPLTAMLLFTTRP